MTSEALYAIAEKNDIQIDYFPLEYNECFSIQDDDGKCYINIDIQKISASSDEKTKLAHEIGHCVFGGFYNRYSELDVRMKHEHRADVWAIRTLMPFPEYEKAVKNGCFEIWQIAEFFDVSYDLAEKATRLYKVS